MLCVRALVLQLVQHVGQGRVHSTGPFEAVGPCWGNTSLRKRLELDSINCCLLQCLMNGTGLLFAKKIFHGAKVVRDCIEPGLPAITVEAALRILRVLPSQ